MPELIEITDLEAFCHVARNSASQEQSQQLLDSIKILKQQGYSVKHWIKAACACVSNPDPLILEAACIIISQIIEWKDTYDGAKHIVLQLRMKPDLSVLEDAKWYIQSVMYGLYAKVGKALYTATEEFPASKMAGEDVAELMHLCLTDYQPYYTALLQHLHKMADWSSVPMDEKDEHMDAIVAFYVPNDRKPIAWYDNQEQVFLRSFQKTSLDPFFKSIRVKKDHEIILKKIRNLYETLNGLKETEMFNEDGTTGPGFIIHQITYYLLVRNSRDPEAMKKLTHYVPDCVTWTFRNPGHSGIELVKQSSLKFLEGVLMTVPNLLIDQLDNIVKLYLSRPNLSLIRSIKTAYGREPGTEDIIHKHCLNLLFVFLKVDDNQKATISDLIRMISEKHSQLLEHNLNDVEKLLANRLSAGNGIKALNNMAKDCPQAFSGRGSNYCSTLKSVECKKLCSQLLPQCLNRISHLNENEASRITAVLVMESGDMEKDASFTRQLLELWTSLVQKYPKALVQAKDTLLKIKASHQEHARSVDYILSTAAKGKPMQPQPSKMTTEKSMTSEDVNGSTPLPNVPISQSLDDMAPAIFICYHVDNKAQAFDIKEDLENLGYLSWIDTTPGNGKGSITQETLRALQNARVTVACISNSSLNFEKCTKEIEMAHRLRKPIIPLMLEDIPWPPDQGKQAQILSNFSQIPFFPRKNHEPFGNRIWSRQSFDLLCRKLYHCGVDPLAPKDLAILRAKLNRSLNAGKKSQDKPNFSSGTSCHIGLSCSPDKISEMQHLKKFLQNFGYSTKVMSYTEASIVKLKCNVVLCALSLRFSKSSMAANEICEISRSGRWIIPLWLDDIPYPPVNAMKTALNGIRPVDCRRMESKTDWLGPEGDALIGRLKEALPGVQNGSKSSNLSSSAPKPLIMDPLVREASEIRIQVRPPTPDSLKTRVPIRPRSYSMSDVPPTINEETESSEEDNEEEEEEEESDNQSGNESEDHVAKDMQKSGKLPKLPQRGGSGDSLSRSRPSSPSHRRRSSVTSIPSRPNRSRSTEKMEQSEYKTNTRPKPKRQTYGTKARGINGTKPIIKDRGTERRAAPVYNPDGPKLPSVYRQRQSSRF